MDVRNPDPELYELHPFVLDSIKKAFHKIYKCKSLGEDKVLLEERLNLKASSILGSVGISILKGCPMEVLPMNHPLATVMEAFLMLYKGLGPSSKQTIMFCPGCYSFFDQSPEQYKPKHKGMVYGYVYDGADGATTLEQILRQWRFVRSHFMFIVDDRMHIPRWDALHTVLTDVDRAWHLAMNVHISRLTNNATKAIGSCQSNKNRIYNTREALAQVLIVKTHLHHLPSSFKTLFVNNSVQVYQSTKILMVG
jgi:hypothetical protein